MNEIIVEINNESTIKLESNIYMKYIINTTFIPFFRSENKYIKYSTFIILNIILLVSLFSMYWYPTYYLDQSIIWTLDLVIMYITYNYLFYLLQIDSNAIFFNTNYICKIVPWKRNTNLFFYFIFMSYWLYYTILVFYIHSEPNVIIQLSNIFMGIAWYLFFSTISLLYYYICNKLLLSSTNLKEWLKQLKKKYKNQCNDLKHDNDDFYNVYNLHYNTIKNFAKYWNFLIFIGFILLIGHVPIDLIAILINKTLFDIPGVIIKSSALVWYLYCICQLNDYEDKIVPYLYKHRIYKDDQIEYINKYIKYRPLGLNFYGIKISGSYITRYLIIGINLLVPALYALLSKTINFT
jgi:hypothetical protein